MDGKANPMQAAAQNALFQQQMARLEKQMETSSAMLQDHENRLVKNEHLLGATDNRFKEIVADLDNLNYRVNKMDNTSGLRKVLENTELSDESINLILAAIDDVQDKVNNQTQVKLEAYVSLNVYNEMQGDFKVLDRRLNQNETEIKETQGRVNENDEKIENSRKRIQRLVSDMALLKRNTSSALEQVRADSQQALAEGVQLDDLANLEISGEGMERMTKMVRVLETNLSRRITSVEDQFGKIAELEEMIEQVKTDGVKPS